MLRCAASSCPRCVCAPALRSPRTAGLLREQRPCLGPRHPCSLESFASLARRVAALTAVRSGDAGGFVASPEAKELDAREPYGAVAARLRRELKDRGGDPDSVADRRAAVLVLLLRGTDGGARVLLTRRSSALKSHPGECALPGGKRDPGDADDASAAKREAFEEVGLPPDSVEVLGCLPPVLSKHCLSVTPVVALLRCADAVVGLRPGPAQGSDNDRPDLSKPPSRLQERGSDAGLSALDEEPTAAFEVRPSTAEVEEVFSCPLSMFVRPPASAHQSRDVRYLEEDPDAPESGSAHDASVSGSEAGVAGDAPPAKRRRGDGRRAGLRIRIHSFQYGDLPQPVWGLTAYVLLQVACLGYGAQPAFGIDVPGERPYWQLGYRGSLKAGGRYYWLPSRDGYMA